MSLSKDYIANANAHPLTEEEMRLHTGEFFARSLDGMHVLTFGKTVDTIRENLRTQYNMSIEEAVLETVENYARIL